MTGVHNGEFMGIPATGRPSMREGITILRVAGSRVVEQWSVSDRLTMLTQTGALPAAV